CDFRQGLQRGIPAGEVTVARAGRKVRRQALVQRLQRRACQQLIQIAVIEQVAGTAHFTATIEAKLKHWNHTAKREKPLSSTRRSCARSVSGTSTFSSAARLRLISSRL